ncbi:hypothetical protein BV22DRAFT_230947 [Leucogyrophana mollusca]|uniref:Uncharacterized protein n=1 Tax=Leucogyrophana mollusca TaxID=85980 RepID=A0ACB8BSQ6_9AGAM|nr:hypothetical protein BV22DRAFT_230947 [Leucogyrophana mollusca]
MERTKDRGLSLSTSTPKVATPPITQPPTDSEREKRTKDSDKDKGKGKEKAKTPKGSSKVNSPIDLGDSAVGKSPGQLADALKSVWGSGSKATTPGASPLTSRTRSIGPTTPIAEAPPVELQKPISRSITPTPLEPPMESHQPTLLDIPPSQHHQPPQESPVAVHEAPVVAETFGQEAEIKAEETAFTTTPADSAPPEFPTPQVPAGSTFFDTAKEGAPADAHLEPPMESIAELTEPQAEDAHHDPGAHVPGSFDSLGLDLSGETAGGQATNEDTGWGFNSSDNQGASSWDNAGADAGSGGDSGGGWGGGWTMPSFTKSPTLTTGFGAFGDLLGAETSANEAAASGKPAGSPAPEKSPKLDPVPPAADEPPASTEASVPTDGVAEPAPIEATLGDAPVVAADEPSTGENNAAPAEPATVTEEPVPGGEDSGAAGADAPTADAEEAPAEDDGFATTNKKEKEKVSRYLVTRERIL